MLPYRFQASLSGTLRARKDDPVIEAHKLRFSGSHAPVNRPAKTSPLRNEPRKVLKTFNRSSYEPTTQGFRSRATRRRRDLFHSLPLLCLTPGIGACTQLLAVFLLCFLRSQPRTNIYLLFYQLYTERLQPCECPLMVWLGASKEKYHQYYPSKKIHFWGDQKLALWV